MFVRTGRQMPHQSGIGDASDSAQQDKVKIVFIREDLKIVSGLNLAAHSDGFRQYQLAELVNVRRHEV